MATEQLKIQQWNSVQQNKTISIPLDDYSFHMIIKKGKLVSKPFDIVYVQAIDVVSNVFEEHKVFRMSLVDSSYLEQEYPAFSDKGLVGQWKLVANTKQLKFIRPLQDVSYDSVKRFLLDLSSHSFVRNRYEQFYVTHKQDTLIP